jgi:two-component system, chemotaxis family, chemotaxis protein CheY
LDVWNLRFDVVSSSRMKPLSILLLDDDPHLMKIAGMVLEQASHRVTPAATVAEALHLLRRQCFDVVLSDFLVGDDDGIEVLREARLLQPTARLIAMSGGGLHLRPSYCLNLAVAFGATAPLLKPFSGDELLAAVEGTAVPIETSAKVPFGTASQ